MRTSYQAEILRRFMSEKEVTRLDTDYSRHCNGNGKTFYVPSPEDVRICDAWVSGTLSREEAATKLGITPGTALNRFARILKARV